MIFHADIKSQIVDIKHKVKYLHNKEIRIPIISGYKSHTQTKLSHLNIGEITGTDEYQNELQLIHLEYLVSDKNILSGIHIYGSKNLNIITQSEFEQYKNIILHTIKNNYYDNLSEKLSKKTIIQDTTAIETPRQNGYLIMKNYEKTLSIMTFLSNDNKSTTDLVNVNYILFNNCIVTIIIKFINNENISYDKILSESKNYIDLFLNVNNLK